jgi:hypothetical protein
MALLSRANALKSVDFPTFWRPTIETIGNLSDINNILMKGLFSSDGFLQGPSLVLLISRQFSR